MHPLEKIIVLTTLCQVLQTTYTLRRLHEAHSGLRWWLEMSPLIAATVALVFLVGRIFHLFPHLVI
jgi:hypothetical protein